MSRRVTTGGKAVDVNGGWEASGHVGQQAVLPVFAQLVAHMGEAEGVWFIAGLLGYLVGLSHQQFGESVTRDLYKATGLTVDDICSGKQLVKPGQVH